MHRPACGSSGVSGGKLLFYRDSFHRNSILCKRFNTRDARSKQINGSRAAGFFMSMFFAGKFCSILEARIIVSAFDKATLQQFERGNGMGREGNCARLNKSDFAGAARPKPAAVPASAARALQRPRRSPGRGLLRVQVKEIRDSRL